MRTLVTLAAFLLLVSSLGYATTASTLVHNVIHAGGLLFMTSVMAWGVSIWISDICDLLSTKKYSSREGRCVLITGCDTGFGHAAALYLNEAGYTVFAGCLTSDGEGADQLRHRCKHPDRMHVLSFDVLSDKDIGSARHVIEEHMSSTGERLHALINNAGIARWAPLEWGDVERDVLPVVDVDLTAVIKISLTFVPLLRQAPESRIIFMTSFITHTPVPFLAPYTVAKQGVKTFADCLRQEVHRDPASYNNMKILNVLPTVFKTGLTGYANVLRLFEQTWDKTRDPVKQAYGERLFAGFCTFIRLCQVFEFVDFFAMRSDLTEVAITFDDLLRVQDPADETELIHWYSRPNFYLARTVVPDELTESLFRIEAPLVKILSFLPSKVLSHS